MMDTLEHRIIVGDMNSTTPPILWKGKSAKEVQRHMYPDHYLRPMPGPEHKSLNPDVKYCREYRVTPTNSKPENFRIARDGESLSVLVEID